MYCADVFSTTSRYFKEKCGLSQIFNHICKYFSGEVLSTYRARIFFKKSAGNAPKLTQFSVDDRAVSDEKYVCGHVASFLTFNLCVDRGRTIK